MSHPPETSLTSRELAERICDELILSSSLARASFSEIASSITALIEAWVREREARTLDPFMALLDNLRNLKSMAEKCDAEGMVETPQKEWTPYQGKIMAYDYCISYLESAIKQLKGGTHGQAEAPVHGEPAQGEPSAAASANSEPGGS